MGFLDSLRYKSSVGAFMYGTIKPGYNVTARDFFFPSQAGTNYYRYLKFGSSVLQEAGYRYTKVPFKTCSTALRIACNAQLKCIPEG
jgi:hypothetical protein